jgi:hypothetical protein
MRPAWPQRAEVVDVLHLTDDRENDVLRRWTLGREGSGRSGDQTDRDGEEEDSSGCRSGGVSYENGRSGSRPKAGG